MFADGEGRKDVQTHRMSGRARDNRLVHVAVPEEPRDRPRPGDLADVIITYPARPRPTARRAATPGKPLNRHLLARQSISACPRSAPLIRYSSLRPALDT